MKKKHLKNRILINIFLVLTCSMVISSLVEYLYFADVVRKQTISDEKAKLQQVSEQIEFMAEDIENFARSIVVDDVLRGLLDEKKYETEFQRLKNIDNIYKRLVFYNSLRTYIGCSFIEQKNNTRFSSSSSSVEEDYINRKFEGEEFLKYSQQLENAFSSPYFGIDTGNLKQVICYRSEILDINHFGEKQGTLYLEIYLEYFLKQIQSYSKDYDIVCLFGNQQNVIYEQGDGKGSQEYLQAVGANNNSGVYKTTEGYLICEKIESMGWKLCVMVNSGYLFERSSFVLYFFIISFSISLALIIVTTSRILENTIRPITMLSEHMENIDYYNLDPREMVDTQDEIQTLYECFNKMLGEIQVSIRQKIAHEKQKKEMEFDIMLSQVNPHYIYNVLNTVVYLAAAQKDFGIVNIVNALIYSLQQTLNVGEDNIYTTIQKEIELTECYITIQSYRYQDTFRVNIRCDDELKNRLVPKTIVQPLVENAILHGILPAEREGIIEIQIIKKQEILVIKVEDDGVGISKEQLDNFNEGLVVSNEKNGRKHIGISNIRDRIMYLYGDNYGMSIVRNSAGGTTVILRVPIMENDL